MLHRCTNPNNIGYKHYGGRGITVCDKWYDIQSFIEDMFPTWEEGLQLDRIDVNGNYEPSNCRWATKSQNAKNKRNKAVVQSTIDYVTFEKKTRKWRIALTFNTIEEAEAALNRLR